MDHAVDAGRQQAGGDHAQGSGWLNEMIEQAAAELDDGKRAELYRQIQLRYVELGPPYHMVGQRIDPFAIRSDVKGVVGHPSWTTRWDLANKG